MHPVAILINIFEWNDLFQAANNSSVESVTFLELHKRQKFRYWE